MCQRFEAEQRVMRWLDQCATREGWAAHRDGKPRHSDSPVSSEAFYHGYDCRASGHPIPWSIVKEFRKESGDYRAEPTMQQADEVCGYRA